MDLIQISSFLAHCSSNALYADVTPHDVSPVISPIVHHTLHEYQRTVTPDLFVNILAAIFIDASSWKSSFAAYGIWI